jgi:hypothetical protein
MFIKKCIANRLQFTILTSLKILSVQEEGQEVLGVEVDEKVIRILW